jgi:hypothetical protein
VFVVVVVMVLVVMLMMLVVVMLVSLLWLLLRPHMMIPSGLAHHLISGYNSSLQVEVQMCALEHAQHQVHASTMDKSEFSAKFQELELNLSSASDRRDLLRAQYKVDLGAMQQFNAGFIQLGESILCDMRAPDWLPSLLAQ